jgi:hypothetical protein
MFLIVLVLLMVWFNTKAPESPPAELWFMMSIFAGLAYVFGFLDSRLFARLDKKNANLLAEVEARQDETPSSSS